MLLQDLAASGTEFHCLGRRSRFDLRVGRRLGLLVRRGQYDAIMTFLFASHFWGSLAASYSSRVRLITCLRDCGVHMSAVKLRIMRSILSRASDTVVANSGAVRDFYSGACAFSAREIQIISNGTDTERFDMELNPDEIRCRNRILPGYRVVTMIGRLDRWKNQFDFLEMAGAMLARTSKVVFLLVGSGPERANIESKVARDRLGPNVRVLGCREDIPQLLGISDVAVSTSISEGMSNALLEGMAARKPIVAWDIPANIDLVKDDTTGILVPLGNVGAFADAVTRLLLHPDEARRLGLEGRKLVERKYSLPRMVDEYQCMLEKVVDPKSAGGHS